MEQILRADLAGALSSGLVMLLFGAETPLVLWLGMILSPGTSS